MLIRLLLIAGVIVVAFIWTDPIPQDPAYHLFADDSAMLGIPNFWNVMSNLAFLVVGPWGLFVAMRMPADGDNASLRNAYLTFYAGVLLTAFGSGWYHLDPSNESLFWDRMPMTVSFAGLFAAVIGEYLSRDVARRILLPFFLIGLGSVIYWQWTEAQGLGDLRPYALVQFVPMLAIPVIIVMSKQKIALTSAFWWLFGWYVVAKLAEQLDAQILAALGAISGHSLKHMFAAVGPAVLAVALARRTRESSAR